MPGIGNQGAIPSNVTKKKHKTVVSTPSGTKTTYKGPTSHGGRQQPASSYTPGGGTVPSSGGGGGPSGGGHSASKAVAHAVKRQAKAQHAAQQYQRSLNQAQNQLQRDVKQSLSLDHTLPNLSHEQRNYLRRNAQRVADHTWKQVKLVSGLTGKSPTIHIGKTPGAAAEVLGAKPGVRLDPNTAAALLGINPKGWRGNAEPGTTPKQMRQWVRTQKSPAGARAEKSLLLHEYAHVGQKRAGGLLSSKVRTEGAAQAFSQAATKRLAKMGHRGYQQTGNYPGMTAAWQRHAGPQKTLYGQFRPRAPTTRRVQSHTQARSPAPGHKTPAGQKVPSKALKAATPVQAKRLKAGGPNVARLSRRILSAQAPPQQKLAKTQRVTKKLSKVAAKAATSGVPAGVPDQYKAAVAKYGPLLDAAVKQAGLNISGTQYLAATLDFESGFNTGAVNSTSGAAGIGQFMPATIDYFKQHGIDYNASAENQIHAAALYLGGHTDFSPLYAGYNPGYGPDPIPAHAASMGALTQAKPIPKGLKQKATTVLGKQATQKIIQGAGIATSPAPAQIGKNKPYVHPFPQATIGRIDQGVDFTGTGPIRAMGNAKILAVGAPGWPNGGGSGPSGQGVLYQLTDGPLKDQTIFVYEGVTPTVKTGQTVKKGQQIASFYPGGSIETGFADSSGVPLSHSVYVEGQPTPWGQKMYDLLTGKKVSLQPGTVGPTGSTISVPATGGVPSTGGTTTPTTGGTTQPGKTPQSTAQAEKAAFAKAAAQARARVGKQATSTATQTLSQAVQSLAPTISTEDPLAGFTPSSAPYEELIRKVKATIGV